MDDTARELTTEELRAEILRLKERISELEAGPDAAGQAELEVFRRFAEAADEGFGIADLDGRVVYANPALCRLLGVDSHGVARGRAVTDFYPEELRERVAAEILPAVKAGGRWSGELTLRARDGRTTPTLENFFLIRSSDGTPLYIADVITDIAEIKNAEEKVLDQLHFMETLMETIPSPIFYKDTEGRYLGCNRGFEKAVGLTRRDLLGKTVHDLYPTELADKYREMDQALIDNPGTQTYEFAIECEDGSRREVIFNKATYARRSDGRVAGLVGVVTDITDHKRAEEEKEKQLTRLEALRSIDMAINASLDLRVTFEVILDQVIRQLHVDAADLLLYNRHLHTLEYASGRGFHTRSLRHANLGIGESYAGKAALERRVVAIPDLERNGADFDRNGAFAREGFVTYMGVPLIAKGEVKGVLEIFNRTPLDPDHDWREFLNTMAGQAAIALDNSTMFEDLQRSNVEITLAYDVTIEGWAHALDLRDRETEGHSRRVTDLTLRLAREIGLPEPELVHVKRGALLHDIGKMGVPDGILLKPGKLTEEEWEVMRLHPVYAYEMLSPIEFLRPAIDIPYSHHERWDGTGYPRGLRKERIPLAARIFAVVDIFDATSSDRPYRKAWDRERVLANLNDLAGTHLDPRMVETFIRLVNE